EEDWSPEQAVCRLKGDGFATVHHETIYQFILTDKKNGGQLHSHLRHQNKTYRKRYGSAHNRNGIVNRVDIDERPKEANNRERIGDWEGDTIIGKVFSFHEQIAKALECNVYFAKPYHSWERGQNENANGLLRQYFPKSMSLLDVTEKEVLEAVHKLNSRPRKCLGFKTPYGVFERNTGINMRAVFEIALMT
ncbi:MAG: IS30 family transposase, partial [Mariprofundus sp.]|nr:IS30 family transposase [Mariprofundus sp.]